MLLRYDDYILVDLTCLFWVLSMIIIIGSCLIIISTDGHPLGTYGKICSSLHSGDFLSVHLEHEVKHNLEHPRGDHIFI